MKVGQSVSYVDPHGRPHSAVITAVVGSGWSGFKLLDLEVGHSKARSVPHESDQESGKGFWQFPELVKQPEPEVELVVRPSFGRKKG